MSVSISTGVVELLANAHSTSSFRGERYYFKGDLCQMSTAKRVAGSLGIQTGIEGGLPFVMSEEDFDRVKEHLISNRIEGWWHYVTNEEYCEIKGEYYFNGKYLRHQEEIQQIADELGISTQKSGELKILFVTSKEDFNAIAERLDITED